MGSFDWIHFFSSKLFTSLTIAYSQYTADKDDIELRYEQSRTRVGLEYTSAKLNTRFLVIENHNIDFGVKVIRYSVSPGELTPLNNRSLITAQKLDKEQAYEGAAYINDIYEINDYLSINVGIRYSRYYNIGPGKVWIYKANAPLSPATTLDSVYYEKDKVIKTYETVEPRVSAKIQFNAKSSIKISYNKTASIFHLFLILPSQHPTISGNFQILISGQLSVTSLP